jgi:hypothetical protein
MKGYIEKVLALSTAHMPDERPDFGSIRNVEHEYGFVLFVDADPREGEPEWIGPTMKAAREQECTLVLFDRDCDEAPKLPSWDW